MKILIIEDEAGLSRSITAYLKSQNYICEVADTYKSALDKVEGYDYDCILLDITLPDGNGLNVLKSLKEDKKTDGVIIISAKDSIDDKIYGLNLGADDYLAKPFSLPELSARVSAVIRRRRLAGSNIIAIDEIRIDTDAKTVCVHDRIIELTRKEYDLLLYLVINKNRIITKSAIAEHIAGDDTDVYDNFDFLYAHIKNLKKKLAFHNADIYIKTVYGMGYKFKAD